MHRVLFVCLGNICRSPLAEGIFRRQAQERDIEVEVDSAGTGDYHVGEQAHPRSQKVGTQRGCDMSMRARQFDSSDFEKFDLIVVMDHQNYRDVVAWKGAKPEKVRLARSFDPLATSEIVPDPFYGQMSDYLEVADMLEAACEGILDTMTPVDAAKTARYS